MMKMNTACAVFLEMGILAFVFANFSTATFAKAVDSADLSATLAELQTQTRSLTVPLTSAASQLDVTAVRGVLSLQDQAAQMGKQAEAVRTQAKVDARDWLKGMRDLINVAKAKVDDMQSGLPETPDVKKKKEDHKSYILQLRELQRGSPDQDTAQQDNLIAQILALVGADSKLSASDQDKLRDRLRDAIKKYYETKEAGASSTSQHLTSIDGTKPQPALQILVDELSKIPGITISMATTAKLEALLIEQHDNFARPTPASFSTGSQLASREGNSLSISAAADNAKGLTTADSAKIRDAFLDFGAGIDVAPERSVSQAEPNRAIASVAESSGSLRPVVNNPSVGLGTAGGAWYPSVGAVIPPAARVVAATATSGDFGADHLLNNPNFNTGSAVVQPAPVEGHSAAGDVSSGGAGDVSVGVGTKTSGASASAPNHASDSDALSKANKEREEANKKIDDLFNGAVDESHGTKTLVGGGNAAVVAAPKKSDTAVDHTSGGATAVDNPARSLTTGEAIEVIHSKIDKATSPAQRQLLSEALRFKALRSYIDSDTDSDRKAKRIATFVAGARCIKPTEAGSCADSLTAAYDKIPANMTVDDAYNYCASSLADFTTLQLQVSEETKNTSEIQQVVDRDLVDQYHSFKTTKRDYLKSSDRSGETFNKVWFSQGYYLNRLMEKPECASIATSTERTTDGADLSSLLSTKVNAAGVACTMINQNLAKTSKMAKPVLSSIAKSLRTFVAGALEMGFDLNDPKSWKQLEKSGHATELSGNVPFQQILANLTLCAPEFGSLTEFFTNEFPSAAATSYAENKCDLAKINALLKKEPELLAHGQTLASRLSSAKLCSPPNAATGKFNEVVEFLRGQSFLNHSLARTDERENNVVSSEVALENPVSKDGQHMASPAEQSRARNFINSSLKNVKTPISNFVSGAKTMLGISTTRSLTPTGSATTPTLAPSSKSDTSCQSPYQPLKADLAKSRGLNPDATDAQNLSQVIKLRVEAGYANLTNSAELLPARAKTVFTSLMLGQWDHKCDSDFAIATSCPKVPLNESGVPGADGLMTRQLVDSLFDSLVNNLPGTSPAALAVSLDKRLAALGAATTKTRMNWQGLSNKPTEQDPNYIASALNSFSATQQPACLTQPLSANFSYLLQQERALRSAAAHICNDPYAGAVEKFFNPSQRQPADATYANADAIRSAKLAEPKTFKFSGGNSIPVADLSEQPGLETFINQLKSTTPPSSQVLCGAIRQKYRVVLGLVANSNNAELNKVWLEKGKIVSKDSARTSH